MSTVSVFSKFRTPLFVQIDLSDVPFLSDADGMETVQIQPGFNQVDENLWEYMKELPPIEKRMEHRKIMEEEPNKALLKELEGAADRNLIGILCSKAREVPDGEEFNGEGATSRHGAIRKIEDQLKELKHNAPTISVAQ